MNVRDQIKEILCETEELEILKLEEIGGEEATAEIEKRVAKVKMIMTERFDVFRKYPKLLRRTVKSVTSGKTKMGMDVYHIKTLDDKLLCFYPKTKYGAYLSDRAMNA